MTERPDGSANRPHTDGLPKTQPLRPSQVRQNVNAKRMLMRLVQGDSPPTAPMNIVDRLAGSPYANPTIQVVGVDASARKTIDFALHLAEVMFRYGAGALEVETSMIAVTAALGLKNVEVDITNQSVAINYAPKDQTPITLLRVVRSWTNNYAGLAQVHQLVTDIVAGGVGRDEAVRRLNEIIRSAKPFPRWMVTMAFGIFAAVFVGVLGGGIGASAVAFGSNILISLLSRQLARWRTADFFNTMACAFLVTFIALMLRWAGVEIAPSIVVAGGILLLLPTGRLVSSVQDAINGFPVTAAGRFLSTLLTFGAIVAGIGVAVVVGTLMGSAVLDVTQTFPDAYPFVDSSSPYCYCGGRHRRHRADANAAVTPDGGSGHSGLLRLVGCWRSRPRRPFVASRRCGGYRLAGPRRGAQAGCSATCSGRPGRADPASRSDDLPFHVRPDR